MNDALIKKALAAARKAATRDEVPVGAVIFDSKTGAVIATAFNQTERLKDPLAHAEVLAIKKACRKLDEKRLNGYSMFVTLEPCTMCAAAISLARLDVLYFGAADPKTGGVNHGARVFEHPQTHHKPRVVSGLHAEECGRLLTDFFSAKRKSKVV